MIENSWLLNGVDPAARQRAVEEAARRGVSLGDYLTDIVLQNALAQHVRGQDAAFAEEAAPALSPTTGDNFAVRHQIKALEVRLGSTVTRLNGAQEAFDSSLFDLAGRLGDVETLADDTAHALGEQLKDLQGGIAALRLGLADIEQAAHASGEENSLGRAALADACGELERRLEGVEAIARGADRAAATLAEAQHAYHLSVAGDMEALSRETNARVSANLDQMRLAADEASAQADVAAAHLIAELRSLRQSIDERFIASATETRTRMQAAFAEAAGRLAALSDRVTVGERQGERHAEHVRAQIADVEDGVQTALEETALALRRADAVLAADIVGVSENNRVALEALRAGMAAETTAMHERHLAATARIAAVETRVATLADAGTARHEALERHCSTTNASLQDAIDQVETSVLEQFDAAAARSGELEQDIAHVRRALGAEIHRVEACTLAALEQQSLDRGAGDQALRRAAEQQAAASEAAVQTAIEDMRQRIEEQMAALRGQQANAQARIDGVSAALANDGPLATVVAATADEVASLRARVLRIHGDDREVSERVAKLETADAQARMALEALRVHVEAVAAQVPTSQDQRLHELELSLADLRLGQSVAGARTDAAHAETSAAIAMRLAELEERQADSLNRLRADIAQFVAENDRRLSALDEKSPDLAAPFVAIEQRLVELEQRDVGTAFAELRARIEDRILGVEQRNVRTLEQLNDTVSLIERRLLSDEPDEEALSA